MIRTLNPGPYLEIDNNQSSYPYISSTGLMSGQVRYNNSSFEVYDGTSWITIGQLYPTISLHPRAIQAIEWTLKKMEEESKIQELTKTHPAVQAAYENFKKSSEQLQSTLILSKDEDLETNSK